jgi:hypothetical protein
MQLEPHGPAHPRQNCHQTNVAWWQLTLYGANAFKSCCGDALRHFRREGTLYTFNYEDPTRLYAIWWLPVSMSAALAWGDSAESSGPSPRPPAEFARTPRPFAGH